VQPRRGAIKCFLVGDAGLHEGGVEVEEGRHG
jgi:hypothetical protein